MKKTIVGFSLALLIAFSLTGCLTLTRKTAGRVSDTTSQSSKAESEEDTDEEDTNEADSNAADSNQVFNKGDTIEYGDCQLTVTKVKKSQGSDYDKPKSGEEFVIVTVKIKNVGKKNLDYNPYYFKMQNSKGQLDSMSFTTVDTDTALESGELAPGGEIEGTIAFEEPKNDAELILQYQDDIFEDDSIISIKCS